MNDYIKKIYEWLEVDYVKNKLGKRSIDIHIDQLNEKKFSKFIEYIDEGIIFLKNLVYFSEQNNLLENFIPTFTIHLLDNNVFEDIKFSSKIDILKYANKYIPPELKLIRKIDKTLNYDNFHVKKSISSAMFGLDNTNFYSYLDMYVNDCDLENECMIFREINIEYNENNSKIIKDVEELVLKYDS